MRFEKGGIYKWGIQDEYFITLNSGNRVECLPIVDLVKGFSIRDYVRTTQFEQLMSGKDADRVLNNKGMSSNPYWQEGQTVELCGGHDFILYQWVNNFTWKTESGLYILDCHLFSLKNEREDRQLYNILRS